MFLHFCSLMPFEKKDDIWLDELKCTKDLAFLLMQQYELISCHTKNQRVVFSALCRNKLFTFKLIIFVSLRFNHQSLHHPIQIQYQWCQLLKSCDQIVQNPLVNYVPKCKLTKFKLYIFTKTEKRSKWQISVYWSQAKSKFAHFC